MSIIGTESRYGSVAQLFHWLTALLVLASFLVSAGGPPLRVYSEARAATLLWHESLSVAVLLLVAARLLWRAFDRIPDEVPMPWWMTLLSRATHWALFALLIAVPATAIAGAWLGGHPVTIYGIGAIGPFLDQATIGQALMEVHGFLGDAVMWLAGLHAAAAIYHHFVLRDRVLKAMLPGRGGETVRVRRA
jgi:cytochrome b561